MSTTTTIRKATTTTTAKATTAKAAQAVVKAAKTTGESVPNALTLAAAKALGITDLTAAGAVAQGRESDVRRGAMALIVFALRSGINGPARTVRDVAASLGLSVGQVSALEQAGAIIAGAGTHAAIVAADAVSWCQGVKADDRAAVLASIKPGTKAYADAVVKATRAMHDARNAAKGAGKGASKGADGKPKGDGLERVGSASLVAVFSAMSARLAKHETGAAWNAETVTAFDALRAQVERLAATVPAGASA